ncbi:MAG: hypothetical protein ACYCPQ_02650 [Elusimicrobiota bacterium]
MNQMPRRRLSLAAGLAGLFLFLAFERVALVRYAQKDARPPMWDQADHLLDAWDYRQALDAGRGSVLWTLPPKPGMPPFPPLYSLGVMGAYRSPKPAQAALLVNWYYLALLCLSIFGIAWEFRPDLTALAAVLIFAGCPAIQDLLFTQLMDLAVAAWVSAAYWALVRSKGFSRWPSSLAFGFACAIGMLHKWSFFSYLLPALWIGSRALQRRESRWKALAALALAASLGLPWYLAQGPALVPKLIQASTDQARAVWRGGALFSYFLNSMNGLGLPLFLLGWLSLLSPQHKRNWSEAWLLPAWVVSSYIFWAAVPNRQMRFLIPGLPALAVGAAAAWPEPLSWTLAAFQIAAAANFPTGTIPPFSIPTPIERRADFFPSRPPDPSDWKIAQILKTADALRDRSAPFSEMTLVANDAPFNGPNFVWTAETSGVAGIKMRAVHKRLCELSEFVLLKKGFLGPPSVIDGLPEAESQIEDPQGWFQRAYAEADRWGLPDGSSAVLFRQKRIRRAPFGEKRVFFRYYRSGPLAAKDLLIAPGHYDAASGDYPRITVSSPKVLFRGLAVRGLRFEVLRADLVPAVSKHGADAWNDVRFLKIGEIRVDSGRVSADDLIAFLENRAKGLSISRLTMDGDLAIAASFHGIPAKARAAILIDRPTNELLFQIKDASIGPLRLPAGWIGRLIPMRVSLSPNPETPFLIDPGRIEFKGGFLTVKSRRRDARRSR